uniref:Uncharacterized protein n=1 Tax=Phasianus colchicus TaxID=9054 RepID=A0A669QLH5_PHACC
MGSVVSLWDQWGLYGVSGVSMGSVVSMGSLWGQWGLYGVTVPQGACAVSPVLLGCAGHCESGAFPARRAVTAVTWHRITSAARCCTIGSARKVRHPIIAPLTSRHASRPLPTAWSP